MGKRAQMRICFLKWPIDPPGLSVTILGASCPGVTSELRNQFLEVIAPLFVIAEHVETGTTR